MEPAGQQHVVLQFDVYSDTKRNPEAAVHLLHGMPVLPGSRTAGVSQH